MSAGKAGSGAKLLGGFRFISRTFEGRFRENPYVLDTDANLYIGPADQFARDEHVAIEVVFHFLNQTGRPVAPLRILLRDRCALLDAFAQFDEARDENGRGEFHIVVFGTYDGDALLAWDDDELPAGPCGKSVNSLKRRFYTLCERLDETFHERRLSDAHKAIEARFVHKRSRRANRTAPGE